VRHVYLKDRKEHPVPSYFVHYNGKIVDLEKWSTSTTSIQSRIRQSYMPMLINHAEYTRWAKSRYTVYSIITVYLLLAHPVCIFDFTWFKMLTKHYICGWVKWKPLKVRGEKKNLDRTVCSCRHSSKSSAWYSWHCWNMRQLYQTYLH